MPATDGDVIQGVMNGTGINGQDVKNVFTWIVHKVSIGDLDIGELAAIVAAALKVVYDTINSVIASGFSYDTCHVYKRDAGEWDYQNGALLDITPIGGGEVMPAGVCMLATAKTDFNRTVGRKFIYGITEADVDAGTLNGTAMAALADFASEYITDFDGSVLGPLDYFRPGVYNTTLEAFRPFSTVAVIKDVISYQRRRKPGVGS